MIQGNDETRTFQEQPSVILSNVHHYLTPILEKNPNHVILYVSINDVVNYEGMDIVGQLLQLK